MSTILVLLFLVVPTVLAAMFIFWVFVAVTLASGRIIPLVLSAVVEVAVTVLFGIVPAPLPPSVKFVELPLVCAAIASGISLRKRDWVALCSKPQQHRPSAGLGVAAFIGGGISAYFVSRTMFGKVILNALDQNVVGTVPSEIAEIRLAGAVFGFIVGAFLVVLIWVAVFRTKLRRE